MNVTCQQNTLLEILEELTSGAVANSISLQSSVYWKSRVVTWEGAAGKSLGAGSSSWHGCT